MASNTITVKPRRTNARSPPTTANNTENVTKGTVLLRNPLPKYSFETKPRVKKSNTITDKVPETDKNVNIDKTEVTKMNDSTRVQDKSKLHNASSATSSTVPSDPVQTGKLVNSFPQAVVSPEMIKASSMAKDIQERQTVINAAVITKDKPVNKVDPFSSITPSSKLTHSVSESGLSRPVSVQSSVTQPAKMSNSHQHQDGSGVTHIPTEVQNVSNENSTLNLSQSVENSCENVETQSGDTQSGPGSHSNTCNCRNRIQHLEEEKQLLKNQLDVQLQVNQELKKLLVASVGEDLQPRLERLTRDKALLDLEVGDYNKKLTEDYEHLDKISIQADMWRSKYLACRVMTDELASSKAYYSMQYQECQMALQQLLNERHELRANLYETYRGLHQVQDAFDPLKSQSPAPNRLLTSKHVIDLARTNQQLVDSIKYRLLPSHVTSSMNNKIEPDWHDYLTQAESHAQELLSREARPEDFRHMNPHQCAIMAPGVMAVDRYHPFTNYDNLTLNVCCKCKGDINIV